MLELKAESVALSDEEIQELHGHSEELFSLSRINSSIWWQQVRMHWLREGDANSKFYHSIISSRSRRNTIQFFMVDGVLVEGVDNVRSTVFSYFSSQFQARRSNRPSMEGMQFRSLSCREGADLIKPFSLDEVKAAVWDCESFKCLGPDGITFGFVKDFWDVLKVLE